MNIVKRNQIQNYFSILNNLKEFSEEIIKLAVL